MVSYLYFYFNDNNISYDISEWQNDRIIVWKSFHGAAFKTYDWFWYTNQGFFIYVIVEVPKHHSSQEIIYNLMDDSYIQIKCSDGFVQVGFELGPSWVGINKIGFFPPRFLGLLSGFRVFWCRYPSLIKCPLQFER